MLFKIIFYVTEDVKNLTMNANNLNLKKVPSPDTVHTLQVTTASFPISFH